MYFQLVSKISMFKLLFPTYWDENVWNLFLVAFPSLTVLPTTSMNVPPGTVDNHDHEENKVEPGKRTPRRMLAVCLLIDTLATHLNPVIKPHDIEKNMSGT